jgi:hypothetical protein
MIERTYIVRTERKFQHTPNCIISSLWGITIFITLTCSYKTTELANLKSEIIILRIILFIIQYITMDLIFVVIICYYTIDYRLSEDSCLSTST